MTELSWLKFTTLSLLLTVELKCDKLEWHYKHLVGLRSSYLVYVLAVNDRHLKWAEMTDEHSLVVVVVVAVFLDLFVEIGFWSITFPLLVWVWRFWCEVWSISWFADCRFELWVWRFCCEVWTICWFTNCRFELSEVDWIRWLCEILDVAFPSLEPGFLA